MTEFSAELVDLVANEMAARYRERPTLADYNEARRIVKIVTNATASNKETIMHEEAQDRSQIRDGHHFLEEAIKLRKEFFNGHQQVEGRVLADQADVEGFFLDGARSAQKHTLRPEAIHAAIDEYEKTHSMKRAIEAAVGKVEHGADY